MDIAEPADVSAHDSGAIAPTLPAATNPRPLRKEDPAVLVPIPAPARKNPARRRSVLTPYSPTALHLVRPSYFAPTSLRSTKTFKTCHSGARNSTPNSMLLVIPTPKAEESLPPTACVASKPCSSADTVCGSRNVTAPGTQPPMPPQREQVMDGSRERQGQSEATCGTMTRNPARALPIGLAPC
jgi:hypothetical protein